MAKAGLLKNVQLRTGTQDSHSVNIQVKDIPIGDINIRENVRKDYTGIDELAESIRQHGLLQPITVYTGGDQYIVKTGHRRLMACQSLYQTDPERFLVSAVLFPMRKILLLSNSSRMHLSICISAISRILRFKLGFNYKKNDGRNGAEH
jgi:ParB family chromosome partitioning protein